MLLCVTLPILFSVMETKAELLQVVGPDTPLIAVAGEDLVLPCFIKAKTSAVDMTVEWYKPDRDNSLVHLYKDHEDTNENQAQMYRGRTSVFKEELQNGNTSLKLSAIRVSDEGEYRCLVENKSMSNETTVHVIVEVQGSPPVIMMESYDSSGGINLVCESRGWKPEPEVLWLDREGVTLPAEETQIHRDAENFSVKRQITVYDYSDSNRFYCRLLQKHHMMETEVIINSQFFAAGKWIVGISISACFIAVGLILISVLHYKKEIKQVKQNAEQLRLAKEDEIQHLRQNAEQQKQELENEIQHLRQNAEQQKQELKNEIMKRIKMFAVDVTLDPDTAHPNLDLSEDKKQVKLGEKTLQLPNTPKRFKYHSVLGKQSFCSGKFYYEVDVGKKTEWTLGVVKESINRETWVKRNPGSGFWTIKLRNNTKYNANADPPVPLTLGEKVELVGVFVDYKEGLVSFYDVNSRSLIYSFPHQTFTEKLYPYFSPRYNEDGKNSDAMKISDLILTLYSGPT
ncbi:butyrophilin subfamily 1 member A1-like isoform X2 [Silurus meridionalis]|uniref:butyrophilin subfamily 1 member A1-like isoform X2 n=1 Tax=Silurus meridionalis TaxID=175797 RepID=UPI001EECAF95|nr:butyrophilin subfamily 1 member A1-like isoform X2 [Silurus meridionalis]